MIFSDQLYRIHGLEPREKEWIPAQMLETVHPKDRDHILAGLSQALETGGLEQEYRVIDKDGGSGICMSGARRFWMATAKPSG
ncbi:PAS domain-containing protein [Paenibacillus sp. CC-CFT747]|nr:PAS domain-containing protein [Paenibacillus sp. CC-CFT747]